MQGLIRVVVVDDHLVTRQGIISLIQRNERIRVVGKGSAGDHVLALLAEHQPDILITDLIMPAQAADPKGVLFEPVSTLQKAMRLYPSLSIIVVSQEEDIQTIQSLAEIGVQGYLLKTDDFTAILDQAVEVIHLGATYFSPEVKQIIFSSPRLRRNEHLTERQLQVLRAVMRSPDASRAAIASSLQISKSTLQKHIRAIFTTLDVPNMESCLLKAMRMRLLTEDEGFGP
ncbi:MAG: response regulator transcription factor [Anaerolineales bacterium]|nr:response regulator transcription factor [Anaerolineales bacterium]